MEIQTQKPSLSELEGVLKTMPQAEIMMTHTFGGGVYVRERCAKADTLIVGKRHRHETISILLKGILGVYNELGEETEIHEAPKIWVSPAGSKRMTYSHTDTILVTVHPTKETDLEKIETEFIIPENEYIENKLRRIS
jgi:hypothetical protein